MTNRTTARDATSGTADSSLSDNDTSARRARGIALIVGAVVIVALIETKTIPFYWFPALTGLTYLAAAAAGRSRGTLWAPGFIITSVGLAAALWLRDGRMPDSFQFLALAVMALGLGGVLAGLLAQQRGFAISAMSVSLSVLLFGVFALLEQQGVKPFAGHTWVYAALLAAWGAYELLRPAGRR
ncbi:MAG: hypothetical protein LC789_15330 [Actinobacteria bacterium]|nr:hypothetical protein [Actinomycetota bacterium]MCA1721652.1 hypothetical protein [Actinomycetota bacterium]